MCLHATHRPSSWCVSLRLVRTSLCAKVWKTIGVLRVLAVCGRRSAREARLLHVRCVGLLVSKVFYASVRVAMRKICDSTPLTVQAVGASRFGWHVIHYVEKSRKPSRFCVFLRFVVAETRTKHGCCMLDALVYWFQWFLTPAYMLS